ncbi:membrane protein [Bradyrhizobium japonicum]|uniref:Membrane protein n=1 Tax=Bradyrhizobium japonicum TaxID=375 RepID=A0A0A3XL93_BRAJP|nr:outer membrane beta-barrel protein [Bradyrhizobium japonicum]KGT73946.1 membrane protein [Bradyrhizobium japonicum]MCW2218691.1 outer membrane immunogenic protein [Bradyrhizobium japonicum]MCW2343305.1 outer membrane immunogenic protein [Bradyrhizobium japonicum]
MKKVLLASASLFALSALAPASAADLAARPYTKAPIAVASIYNWSGFYLGINGGGASSRNCWDVNNIFGIAGPDTAEGCHNATGGVVGGQVGYRWQSANWVFGLEAQGDWANLKGSNTSLVLAPPPLVNQTKIDGIGLFTGQVGYAWNNVLWYVKGGAAVTHAKYNGLIGGVVLDSASETRWGGAVGTGLEFGFAPGWSVAIEYDHLFMGQRNNSFTFLGINDRIDRIKQDVDMGTVRVNYTFGGPVVAKY